MKNLNKHLLIGILFTPLTSCAYKSYVSASYGGLKTYTEKPRYNGEKKVATYISGSLREARHPHKIDYARKVYDNVLAGHFSIYRVTVDKGYNFYYGLGTSFGRYRSGENLKNENKETESFF